MNRLDMKGRTVIVTGGSSGIGLAIVQRLINSGANVAIWDMDNVGSDSVNITSQESKLHFEKVDVTRFSDVLNAFSSTTGVFPKIDALVNSAGVAGQNELVSKYPIEEWLRVHDVNLNGTFYCCRTVIPHMEANNYGRIVNIASIAGKEGNPTASAYSSSKAAVIALTKSIGKELAKKEITVNQLTL